MMTNDFVQATVVTKNEIVKCLRGKKFLISMIVVAAVFVLITLLQFMMKNWDRMDNMGRFVDVYFSSFPIVLTLVIALISSVAIVSEFEERTALILFTRPIRRTSIMIGKVICCILIEALIIAFYYILACGVGLIKGIGLTPEVFTSFGIAVAYVFAASGIAFVVSSFFKKGSVCTIISLLVLLVILPISSAMMGTDGGENWFMLDKAADTMYTCYPEYVDLYNQASDQFVEVVKNATLILKGFASDNMDAATTWLGQFIGSPDFQSLDSKTQASLIYLKGYLEIGASDNLDTMIRVLEAMTSSSMFAPMQDPDTVRSAVVLVIWGLIGFFISWVRFIRREF